MESEASQVNNNLFDSIEYNITVNKKSNSLIIKGEDKILNLIENSGLSNDKKFELKTEARILKLAYTHNKLLSLSNSRTQILAHQVESTHRIINSLNQRFLIADEVGLGKTIEAGLVIKELIFRHDYKRILITCPASLTVQWQNELQSKFNELFTIMDRKTLKKHKAQNPNPWEACDKIICSLDFIKNKSNLKDLQQSKWDIIIIDEAHRLRRDSQSTTLAYNAAEILSKNTKALLLLTATPFRGKLEELYYLVRLVDKNLLGPFQTFFNTYCFNNTDLSMLQEKLSTVIIRRTKKEVGGFTRRHAKTIRFELFPDERILYDATTRYVIEEFNKAMQSENRAIGFVMTVFQKLLDSSTFALLSALRKRRDRLSSLINGDDKKIDINMLIQKKLNIDLNDIDDDEEYYELIDHTYRITYEEIKEEMTVLDNLIGIAESITINKKGERLRELLLRLKKNKCKKVIIFTQFRTTQEFLKNLLWDFKVELFHGSLDKDQKEDAIQNFKDDAEVLITTEAGGEGRNLQFCNALINYDLPWSPLKIEQRIGRIHRFGQPKDVYVYNFSTKDTVAERILQVLTHKLKLFEKSIGTPDILLGQIEDGLNLNSIFMEMASKKKSIRKINSEIDEKLSAARESYEKLTDLTISKKMDFNYDEYYRITLQDRQYSNLRIENFVNTLRKSDKAVDLLLGKKHKINRLYSIRALPDGLGSEKKQGTFDSNRALGNENIEFLAFGNPIIDSLVNRCCDDDFGGLSGVKIINHNKQISGMIFYYLVSFSLNVEHQEIIPVFVSSNNSVKDYELDDIESKSIEQVSPLNYKLDKHTTQISRIKNKAPKYFDTAREKIMKKIDDRIMEISSKIGKSITPEIDKINDSYDTRIKEFDEQLSRQICQMKWFKKDMKGAITRTKNRIAKEKQERDALLARYKGYGNVRFSIELLNAGVLIGIE